jgi:hypothetical protein
MSTQYVTSVKTARMEAVRSKINTGTGTSCVKIYTSPRPATGGTPTGATILASLDLPADCGSVADGVLTLTLPASSTVLATGDHNWARVFDRDGGIVADMGTGLTGGGADMEIPVATLYSGATLKPTAGYLRDA